MNVYRIFVHNTVSNRHKPYTKLIRVDNNRQKQNMFEPDFLEMSKELLGIRNCTLKFQEPPMQSLKSTELLYNS